jgi:hypothetical protein
LGALHKTKKTILAYLAHVRPVEVAVALQLHGGAAGATAASGDGEAGRANRVVQAYATSLFTRDNHAPTDQTVGNAWESAMAAVGAPIVTFAAYRQAAVTLLRYNVGRSPLARQGLASPVETAAAHTVETAAEHYGLVDGQRGDVVDEEDAFHVCCTWHRLLGLETAPDGAFLDLSVGRLDVASLARAVAAALPSTAGRATGTLPGASAAATAADSTTTTRTSAPASSVYVAPNHLVGLPSGRWLGWVGCHPPPRPAPPRSALRAPMVFLMHP